MGFNPYIDCVLIPEYPRPVEFRLGLNTIHAIANLLATYHPNVLRLEIVPGRWDSLVRRVTLWMPHWIQALVRRIAPRPFLPATVVLKRRAADFTMHRTSFRNEKAMYQKLAPLQGQVIPYYYGETVYDEAPAHVLSLVEGVALLNLQPPRPSVPDLVQRLHVAADAMKALGVRCTSGMLEDVFLADSDGRVVRIDLGTAVETDDNDNVEQQNYRVMTYVKYYATYIGYLKDETATEGQRFVQEWETRYYGELQERRHQSESLLS